MPIEILSYKSKPILKITKEGSPIKIQFGITKTKLIIEGIEAIKDFIIKYEVKNGLPYKPIT